MGNLNLLTHNWNGSAITQLTESTNIAKIEIPAGYVNATQMCQSSGKFWADYARLDSTKAYWEALSLDMGIAISNLVIPIKGRADKIQQGTWTHPEIAIDLAQWVSVEFRIWANRTLKQVIQNQSEPATQSQDRDEPQYTVAQPQEPQPALPPAVPTPAEISELADLIYSKTNVPPELQAGMKANAIAHHHPALKPTMEIFKTALSIPVESELLSPTQLSQILGDRTNTNYTARQINKLLLEQGFQERNPEGGNNPAYLPTEKGEPYCKLILNTAQGRDKTIQSLRWFKSVLEALEANDH